MAPSLSGANGLTLEVTLRSPFDTVQGVCLIPHVLEATPEMLWQSSIEEATERMHEASQGFERVELCLRDPLGALVGFAVLVEDSDSNIGDVCSIQWLYVLPEYRGVGGRMLLKECMKVTQGSGYEVMAYTKRLSEGRFELTYRRLKPHKE